MPPGDGARAFLDSWRDGVRPEPRLTVSEWAEAHRILSPRTSARPGPRRDWRGAPRRPRPRGARAPPRPATARRGGGGAPPLPPPAPEPPPRPVAELAGA